MTKIVVRQPIHVARSKGAVILIINVEVVILFVRLAPLVVGLNLIHQMAKNVVT